MGRLNTFYKRNTRMIICGFIICSILLLIVYIYRNRPRFSLKEYFSDGSLQEYHFYNKYHYGDNILNLKFFYNISNSLKENNILIHYYYNNEYCKNKEELDRYVNTETLILHPITEKPELAIELWMGNNIQGTSHETFDIYYAAFYKEILKHLGLDTQNIDTSLYQNEPYLDEIYDRLDPKYKDIDILVLNCPPASGQYAYNKDLLDKACIELSKKYRVVTSCYVSDEIPSTVNDKLTMQDVGAVSTRAKYIVSANSGPFVTCLNLKTKQSVKHWFLLDKGHNIYDKLSYTTIKDLNTLVGEINKVAV